MLNDSRLKRMKAAYTNFIEKKVDRRSFLKGMFAAGGLAAVSIEAAKSPKMLDQFFQKHYKELTPEDKKRVFQRIAADIKTDYQVDVTISDPQPLPKEKVHFVYCLNLSKCNGNRLCVEACRKENNLGEGMAYIKVLEMDAGGFNFENSNQNYEGTVPKEGKFYLPVQCNQCDNPPCVKACPIEATWKEDDGIVVVDYDWCIGCRYCQVACPYEARHFNFRTPELKKEDVNPNQSYLSNRIRPRGVMEKCTFCLHRTRNGQYPACQEACPTGARKFGNLLDPNSEVALIMKEKKVFVLKEELNTLPRFFYYFD